MPDGLSQKKEKRALLILYILTVYILFQLVWWGFNLVKLNSEILELKTILIGASQLDLLRAKVWMVIGEGAVFFILLALGFWYIKKTVIRELMLARMEKTFLLSVTHELKTPIAAIKLQLETMKSRKLSEEQSAQLIGNALSETRRLQSLTENILLATRLDQKQANMLHERVNMSKVVFDEIQRFASFSAVSFVSEMENDLILPGDQQMLSALVANLLDNAMKYGGKSQITVELAGENDELTLRVSDNGSGITDDEKKKIFEKFYRSGNEETRTSKGTGLGLYICSNIVRLHHGKISVMNNSPSGSIFAITLPMFKK
jgi:two-component system sensor histidine kinase CiaH